MCCGMSPRALLILISCWAILQSIVYLVFSILGILIQNCNFSMEGSQFNYLLYLTYFRDGTCDNIKWEVLGITQGPITVDPTISEAAGRTGDFLYAYLVLSCAWIVSSMSLIVATFTPCMSLLCLKLFSFPWVITCAATLIMDVVATVFHIIDITNTTDIEGFLTFIGFPTTEGIVEYFATVPAYLFPMPSVTMMLVTFRGFLLWAVNISCLIYVIRGVRKILRNELMKKNQPIRPDFGYEREFNRPEVNSPNSIEDTSAQMAEISRYNDPSLTNQYQYDNNGFAAEQIHQQQQQQVQQQIPPNQRYVASGGNYVFVSEKRFLEPLKGGGIAPRSDDGMSGMSRLSNARSLDSVDDASRASSNIGTRSHTSDRTIDYENELATPIERLSYLSGDSMFDNNNNRRSQGARPQEPPAVPVKPSMIKQLVQQQQQQQLQTQHQHPQYMRQHQQIREEEPYARTSYQTPPDELRSQLPWSYFQDRDEMTRPQKQRSDEADLPPVPVPDYTLHFPKKERPATKPKPTRPVATDDNTDNSNERWSGPEYTY